MAERELKVKFTGDTKGLQKSLTGAQKAVKSTGDTISKAGKAIATGVAAGAAAAVAFGVKSVDTYKNVGGEVLKLQRYTGDTAENASRMRAAFKLTGIDTDKAARSFGIFSKNIAAGKIDKLGINLKDVHGQLLPFDQALGKVADKIASMPPGTARTALAIQAFGKAGTDLLPFLSKGSKGILELANQSDKLGTTLSGKDIDAIKKSKEESRKFGLAMEGLQIQIGRYVLPVLTDLVKWATEHLLPALDKLGHKIADWLAPRLKKLGDWWDKDGKKSWEHFTKWITETLLPLLEKVGKDVVEKVVGAFQAMVDWMRKHPNWAAPILAGFAAILLIIELTNIAFVTTPWGAAITGLLAVGAAFEVAYRSNSSFAEGVDRHIWGIKNGWSQLAGWLEPVVKTIKAKWDELLIGIANNAGQIHQLIRDVASWYDWLKGPVGAVIGWIENQWAQLVWGTARAADQIRGVLRGIAAAFDAMKGPIAAALGWIEAQYAGMVWRLAQARDQLAPIGNAIVQIFGAISSGVTSIIGVIDAKVDQFVSGLKTSAETLKGLLDKIQSAGSWLSQHNPLDLGNWIPGIPGGVMAPAPPALAAGGVVPGTAHGTLILAGENNQSEVVSPIPAWMNRGGGGSSRTYNINVSIPPGGDSLRAGRDIVKAIKSWEQVAGSGWRAS